MSSKTQWLSGLYYADFISFYSPTQLCGGGTTKSNSNELPISVPLSFLYGIATIFTLVVFEAEQKADTTKQREEQPSASHIPKAETSEKHAS